MVCVGGNVRLPGFVDRLRAELPAWVNQGTTVNVDSPLDPVRHAWHCGRELVSRAEPQLAEGFVSRAEYLEHGESLCLRRFGNFFSF